MPPTTDPLAIRVATDLDVPRIIELMRVALGEGNIPRTREFFDWKHRQNPFGQSPAWVAEASGQLVGVRIFMPWRWHWGTEHEASAVRAVDTATHPDFQGKGIFKRLTLALVEQVERDGVGFVFNTPNEKSRPGYLKMGWVSAGKAALWLRPEATARGLFRLLRLQTAPPLSEEEQRSPTTPSATLLAALADAESAGLLREWIVSGDLARYRTPKSAAYLRWRYAACPAAPYQVATVDPRLGFAIYRVRQRHGLRELSISELLFERSLAGVRAAVAALARARREARADYALIAFERDRLQGLALGAAGFVPAPKAGPIVTTRALNPDQSAPDPQRVSSFRASIGDLELF